MLGGGVFGNEMGWIAAAIERACVKFGNTPLDVRIVSYGQSIPREIEALLGPQGSVVRKIAEAVSEGEDGALAAVE